jgi:hypothetical protein
MENNNSMHDIFSKAVRAGKRTYFFDVKETKSGEYYITLTESKKRLNGENGKFFYEKHKIFLYKEDFEKFTEGLNDVVDYIREHQEVEEFVNHSYDESANDTKE